MLEVIGILCVMWLGFLGLFMVVAVLILVDRLNERAPKSMPNQISEMPVKPFPPDLKRPAATAPKAATQAQTTDEQDCHAESSTA